MGVPKRVVASVGAGVVLAGVLAGCSSDGGQAAACEKGYAAIDRMSAASSAETTTEAGLAQVFSVNEEVAKQLRDSGATGELAEAHEATAAAIEEFTRASRARMAKTGSEGAVDAAQVKVLDAASRVDAICG
ncbi:hypothetical protein CH252_20950 [Rhodococcus sp. 06-1477-1B]|nr:hypothetical protein CH252_20950 [Rhodococcus sp. 06-1477-1B]